jgi:hypothetical protein
MAILTYGHKNIGDKFTSVMHNLIYDAINSLDERVGDVESDQVALSGSAINSNNADAQTKGYTAKVINDLVANVASAITELGTSVATLLSSSVWLTQAEYEVLEATNAVDPNKEYKIYDPDSDLDWIGGTPDTSGGEGVPSGSSIMTTEEVLAILNS